ncbi:MAG TPA: hypothetical protein VFM98_01780 [Ramlibacter sp.]|uniref:hypothetical protein n=1 Tax=Ramlibacter sp. TaxID=1917967 RepID=UPI002D7FA4D1|nr:hypothetical protein [Ramlibacter sp.]HET8744305.1 hypothetical protein [Ramlibacter sp.]
MTWLSRELVRGPYLALCTSEEQFRTAIRPLKLPPEEVSAWIRTKQAHATTHFFTNQRGELCCVVCIKVDEGRTPVEICGLLVHEAVHVFQQHCGWVGEDAPSAEFEAYSIQAIAQNLLQAYAESLSH